MSYVYRRPWDYSQQHYLRSRRKVSFKTAVVGSGQISGSISCNLSTTANLIGVGELSSSLTPALSTTGALLGFGELNVALIPILSTTGSLNGIGELNTSILLQFSVFDGYLNGFGTLAGSLPLSLSAFGVLQSDGYIDGYADGYLTSGAILTGTGSLITSLTPTLNTTATISGVVDIASAISMLLTTNSTLVGDGYLSGFINDIILSTNGLIDGYGQLVANISNILTPVTTLTGIGSIDGYSDGYLTTTASLSSEFILGNILNSLSTSGTLTGDGYLAGFVSSILSTSADGYAIMYISGQDPPILNASGTLTGLGSLGSLIDEYVVVSGLLDGYGALVSSLNLGLATTGSIFNGNIGAIISSVNLSITTSGSLAAVIPIFSNINISLSTSADISVERPFFEPEIRYCAPSAVGHIVRHDLNNINFVVQNSHLSYIKELIIGILRDEFGKDSYYHYVADEFGFPKTPANHNLPIGAGYDDETTTRIFIGEAFRHDIVFYPSIIVKQSSSSSVPISFNRNRETIQYCAIKVVNDDGTESVVTTPHAFVFQGAWEGTVNVDIITRDILSRDDLASFCSLLFVDIKHDELLKAGLLIKNVSGSFSDGLDRQQEKIYKCSLSIDVRSEWKREIPINNFVDILNICIDFGRFDTSGNFEAAPNLTANISEDLLGDFIADEVLSAAPWEEENIMGVSRSAALISGTILGVLPNVLLAGSWVENNGAYFVANYGSADPGNEITSWHPVEGNIIGSISNGSSGPIVDDVVMGQQSLLFDGVADLLNFPDFATKLNGDDVAFSVIVDAMLISYNTTGLETSPIFSLTWSGTTVGQGFPDFHWLQNDSFSNHIWYTYRRGTGTGAISFQATQPQPILQRFLLAYSFNGTSARLETTTSNGSVVHMNNVNLDVNPMTRLDNWTIGGSIFNNTLQELSNIAIAQHGFRLGSFSNSDFAEIASSLYNYNIPLAGTWAQNGGAFFTADYGVSETGQKSSFWYPIEGDIVGSTISGFDGPTPEFSVLGRKSLLFDGVNDILNFPDFATKLNGDDVAFSTVLDGYFLSFRTTGLDSNVIFALTWSLSAIALIFPDFHWFTVAEFSTALYIFFTYRRGTTGLQKTQSGPPFTAGNRFIAAYSFDGSMIKTEVTTSSGTITVYNNLSLDTDPANNFDNWTIGGAYFDNNLQEPTNIAIVKHGFRLGTFSDSDFAAIAASFGT